MISNEDVEEFLCKSDVMVFRPTKKEFKNFSKYVEYMEECGAAKWGVAKIIPPKGWKPCRDMKKKLSQKKLLIENPILQEITSTHSGIYQQMNIEQPALTVQDFAKEAQSDRYKPPEGSLEFLEQRYWRGLTFNPPLYGADVPASLYDTNVKEWNVPKLGDVLEEVCNKLNVKIPGVNSPYLYFGMWRTTFPWHVEDMDLYSINYLHYGQPKFWYAIPECHASRFQTMIRGIYPDFFKVCPEFMRHKMTIVSPKNLARNGIPVNRMVQRAGEFMITFPNGYHSGFNMGYNAAESVNFALHRWLDVGKISRFCVCYSDTVSINMDDFIDEYNLLYDKDIQKFVRKQPKKTIVTAQNDELLKKMRNRRKLADYRSENNTRAIARRTRHRQKMKYRKRKIKRWRSKVLLKRCVKRVCCRNLVIDPLPDLDYEVKFESDEEEDTGRITRSQNTQPCQVSIRILPSDPHSSKFTDFPSKVWFSRAMGCIEKDFTLRGENVPLRSVYVRPGKDNSIDNSETSYGPSDHQTSTSLEKKMVSAIKSEPEDAEEPKIFIQNINYREKPSDVKINQEQGIPDKPNPSSEPQKKKESRVTDITKLDPHDNKNITKKPAEKEKSRKRRKKKASEISLDLPDSFMLRNAPDSQFTELSASDSGKDLSEFSELMETIEELPPRINKRRTRKNKGGRPNKLEQMKLMQTEQDRLNEQQMIAEARRRAVMWESTAHLHVPTSTVPIINEEDVYHVTVETSEDNIRSKREISPVVNISDSVPQPEGHEDTKSDWRLCIMHKVKAEDDKPTRKRRYLDRMRMRPTFGSTGPYLSQEKINAIVEAESTVRIQKNGKRINVKLKDLIIFDKKIIASNVENRDKNGRLRVNKCSAYSGFESMLKITWIFDHTYSTPNTLISPENVVTVPIGDSRYKVIHVDIDNQTTKSYTGRSFVNQHAKWSPRILSMGHNIMAIFNYQAFSGTGFTFDDTATHPEPSVVRHVSSALCQKILDQRQHILVQRRERQKADNVRKAKKRGRPRKKSKELTPAAQLTPPIMLPHTQIIEEDPKRRRTSPPVLEEVQGDFGLSPLHHSAPLQLSAPAAPYPPPYPASHPVFNLMSAVSCSGTRNLISSPRLQLKIKSVQSVSPSPPGNPTFDLHSPCRPRPQSDYNVASHQVVRTSIPQQQMISLDQFNFPVSAANSGGLSKRRVTAKPPAKSKSKSKFAMYDFREPDSLPPGSSQFGADFSKGCLVNQITNQLTNQMHATSNVSLNPGPRQVQTHVDQMREQLPMTTSTHLVIGSDLGRSDIMTPPKLPASTWDMFPGTQSERALKVRRFLESASGNSEMRGDAVLHRDSINNNNLRIHPDYLRTISGEGSGSAQHNTRCIVPHETRGIVPPDTRSFVSHDTRSIVPPDTRSIVPHDTRTVVPPDSRTAAPLEGMKNIPTPENVSEEHIQWCLKTNNVDDFRVWDAANNLPVYKPPSERVPSVFQFETDNSNKNLDILLDSKQNMEKLLYEPLHLDEGEQYKRMREISVDIPSPQPMVCMPPSVQRREEWRKLREQKLAGVPPPADDEIQEIVTIYNPPNTFDVGLDQRNSQISPGTVRLSEEASTSSSMRYIPAPISCLMPNPDSADFQLYRSNFENNR